MTCATAAPAHFVECIRQTRALSPATRIEVLVPDFRGRDDRALDILKAAPPDVMNHNLETVPRLYKEARPGSDYAFSLNLLKKFKALHPGVPTKSGLMVGLGETDEEILQTMRDMRAHDIDMLTIGQYLAPSGHHLPVRRYVHPDTFRMFEAEAAKMGFTHAAVGAMVRSSYHADQQAHAAGVADAVRAVATRERRRDRQRGLSAWPARRRPLQPPGPCWSAATAAGPCSRCRCPATTADRSTSICADPATWCGSTRPRLRVSPGPACLSSSARWRRRRACRTNCCAATHVARAAAAG